MNQFAHLDGHYPTVGNNRLFGEVVCIEVQLTHAASNESCLLWGKRKAVYVNASVNAYHLHRQLCSDLMHTASMMFQNGELSAIKRKLAWVVNYCYIHNARNDYQCYDVEMRLDTDGFAPTIEVVVKHHGSDGAVKTLAAYPCAPHSLDSSSPSIRQI